MLWRDHIRMICGGSCLRPSTRVRAACRSWPKVSAARKRTGRMERPSYRPGAKGRIDEQALAGILRSQPDATLVELQSELESQTGLRVSTQHLWRVVKRLGFRLKKSHSTPKNVTRTRTASGAKSSSR